MLVVMLLPPTMGRPRRNAAEFSFHVLPADIASKLIHAYTFLT
jgi:hypothetical protein